MKQSSELNIEAAQFADRHASVEVEAPSRLHFGLLSFGLAGVRPFGGLGVMIDAPTTRVRVTPAAAFAAVGPNAERVTALVDRLQHAYLWPTLPDCRVEVLDTPPAHAGFGTGTQLALSVATAVLSWQGDDLPAVDDLAHVVGRGLRSAIGAWGFALGGLIVEGGHPPLGAPRISPLIERCELPSDWRWVLVTPRSDQGMSGAAEREAFARLPAVSAAVTGRLCDELWYELHPAARNGDYARFAASLYRYGVTAGECFAAVQGGPFASDREAALVQRIRALGVSGVGQSSWGPTVFALLPNEVAAHELVGQLQRTPEAADAYFTTTGTCNHGARVAVSR
jgi:beta-RFAP synthase